MSFCPSLAKGPARVTTTLADLATLKLPSQSEASATMMGTWAEDLAISLTVETTSASFDALRPATAIFKLGYCVR